MAGAYADRVPVGPGVGVVPWLGVGVPGLVRVGVGVGVGVGEGVAARVRAGEMGVTGRRVGEVAGRGDAAGDSVL